MNFPTIDLQNYTLANVDDACRTWGSFVLLGHDIHTQMSAQVFSLAQQFFAQPTELKNTIRRSDTNAWGFYDAELTKNRPDWKEIIDIGPAATEGPLRGATPQWPNIPAFQETIEQLTDLMHQLALDLVQLLSEALQTDEDLSQAFKDHSSFLRLNYYPTCPDPAAADVSMSSPTGQLGISHHTDAGAVTVLMPDNQPGLQFLNGDRWHTVNAPANALIINIGDIVQVWSNNRYRAPLHRVLANSEHQRFSVPYFLNPSYDYDYAPLTSGLGAQKPPAYQAINWGEFRAKRSAGDYANIGEEVQISHYALANRQL